MVAHSFLYQIFKLPRVLNPIFYIGGLINSIYIPEFVYICSLEFLSFTSSQMHLVSYIMAFIQCFNIEDIHAQGDVQDTLYEKNNLLSMTLPEVCIRRKKNSANISVL